MNLAAVPAAGRTGRRRLRFRAGRLRWLTIAAALVGWEIAVRAFLADSLFIAPPSRIALAFRRKIRQRAGMYMSVPGGNFASSAMIPFCFFPVVDDWPSLAS